MCPKTASKAPKAHLHVRILLAPRSLPRRHHHAMTTPPCLRAGRMVALHIVSFAHHFWNQDLCVPVELAQRLSVDLLHLSRLGDDDAVPASRTTDLPTGHPGFALQMLTTVNAGEFKERFHVLDNLPAGTWAKPTGKPPSRFAQPARLTGRGSYSSEPSRPPRNQGEAKLGDNHDPIPHHSVQFVQQASVLLFRFGGRRHGLIVSLGHRQSSVSRPRSTPDPQPGTETQYLNTT